MLNIFGGTFDPIHNGHLWMANAIAEKFNIKVALMPLAIPPHKNLALANIIHRVAMLNLALIDYPRLFLNLTEAYSLTTNYTYQTLKKLITLSPINYIIGSDSLVSLDSWDNWQELLKLCSFIILPRQGFEISMMSKKLKLIYHQNLVNNFGDLDMGGKFLWFEGECYNISSTMIRTKIKNKQIFNNFIPLTVFNYIKTNMLYI